MVLFTSTRSNSSVQTSFFPVRYMKLSGLRLELNSRSTKATPVTSLKLARVLHTAPPIISNLAPFHPDGKDTSVVSTFTVNSEFVGVIKATCIPENYSITHLPSAAAPSNQLSLKDWPYSLRLDSTGPVGLNLFRVIFGANYTLSGDLDRL
jgi:hypothetical protein